MTSQQFQPGDRCSTPTLGNGTIQPQPWVMPFHSLIQFDSGELLWIPCDILQPPIAEVKSIRRKRGKAA